MSDIRIVRRRNRAHILGKSKLGAMWIIENMDGEVEIKVEVQSEFVSDLHQDMLQAGLYVEIQ